MRRVLVVLLGLGLAAAEGAAGRPTPPGGVGGPLIAHPFDPWRYDDGMVLCRHWEPEHPTRPPCDRPADEHAQGSEPAEDGGS